MYNNYIMSYLQQYNQIRKNIQMQNPEMPFRQAQQLAKQEYGKQKAPQQNYSEYYQSENDMYEKPQKKIPKKGKLMETENNIYSRAPNKAQIRSDLRGKIKQCKDMRKQLIKQLQEIDNSEKIYSQQLQSI